MDAQVAALARLRDLFLGWSRVPPAGLHTFVSGSFRLGVQSAGSDIDVLFVVRQAAVSREAVFSGFLAHLQGCPDVADVEAVPTARVPVIGVRVLGQEFDVLTCHLPDGAPGEQEEEEEEEEEEEPTEEEEEDEEAHHRGLPSREELLTTYEWMNGLPEPDVLSFNGPRVTELLGARVGRPRLAAFLDALRYVRHWAQQRRVYGNKAGYLGGVNLALMLGHVVLRAAEAAPTSHGLVAAFFSTFARWDPRQPVELEPSTAPCPAWLQHLERIGGPAPAPLRRQDAFTVLSPCFPRFNTTFSASRYTWRVVQDEVRRAASLLERGATAGAAAADVLQAVSMPYLPPPGGRYLRVTVTSSCKVWAGYVKAQARHLVGYLSQEDLGVACFRDLPVWVPRPPDQAAMYIYAPKAEVPRRQAVRGDPDRSLRYFMETHAGGGGVGPPRPPGASVALEFCASADPVALAPFFREAPTPGTLALLQAEEGGPAPTPPPSVPAAAAGGGGGGPSSPSLRELLRPELWRRIADERPPPAGNTVFPCPPCVVEAAAEAESASLAPAVVWCAAGRWLMAGVTAEGHRQVARAWAARVFLSRASRVPGAGCGLVGPQAPTKPVPGAPAGSGAAPETAATCGDPPPGSCPWEGHGGPGRPGLLPSPRSPPTVSRAPKTRPAPGPGRPPQSKGRSCAPAGAGGRADGGSFPAPAGPGSRKVPVYQVRDKGGRA